MTPSLGSDWGFVIPSDSMVRGGSRANDNSERRSGAPPSGASVLLALLDLIRTEVDLDALLHRVVDLVAQAMGADRATLFLIDKSTGELVSRAAHLPELPEIRLPKGHGIAGHVALSRCAVASSNADAHPQHTTDIDRITGYRTVTVLAAPVLCPGDPEQAVVLGVLQVLNKRAGLFDDSDRDLLIALAKEVGIALSETALRERVTEKTPERYHKIVGSSAAMRRVYDLIARAAATSATVLLRGESGTGKELAARAIHYNSSRSRGPFVKIDCTAIPDGLMESELFGHERGAFTGAEQRVLGKAELAHGGTLFLDEIGDLKLTLQGKLLRLLQDREFERVGGRKTIAVDVRVVSATHRDLLSMSDAGTFRKDLYYRLKVVELPLPTLRERGSEDIERLAQHFAEVFARRHRKAVSGISRAAIDCLRSYSWPGNIRELEHCIESAVALCAGSQLTVEDLPLPPGPGRGERPARMQASGGSPSSAPVDAAANDGLYLPNDLTLEEAERRYLLHTIARCTGNRSKAAQVLGIGRNTLLRKLKEPDS